MLGLGKEGVVTSISAARNWRDYVGRFSVECEMTNQDDLVLSENGFLPQEQVRRTRISGLVDTGATRLVLPAAVAKALGLRESGEITVKYADGRRERRKTVESVRVEIQGRSGIFSAVIGAGTDRGADRSDCAGGARLSPRLHEADSRPT